MKALTYSILLQLKLDVRNKNVLSAYYILPIVLYLVIGAIFIEVNPMYKDMMVSSMQILAISLAAFLGTPAPILNFFTSDAKKTYKVGNINLIVIILTTYISAMAHMTVVSSFIYGTAPLIFGVKRPNLNFEYVLWVIIFMSICTVIGMFIGLFSKNNASMTMTSQLLFLPSMLLSGILLPVQLLPDILQNFGKVLPATHGLEILIGSENLTFEMVLPLIVLAIIAVTALIVRFKQIQID